MLITCPDCENRHVISDHLKIFSDTSITIEDIMRDKGQLVKRGTLSGTGDVEFWEDRDKREGIPAQRSAPTEEVNRQIDDL